MVLRASNDELSDLSQGSPELIESELGARTGLRLLRRIGTGGMATVYLAERISQVDPRVLSIETPSRLAIKIMQPETVRQYAKLGGDAYTLFKKEVMALSKLAQVKPPTPYVVAYYGCGLCELEVKGENWPNIPWIALEYVDGGVAGTSLKERIQGGPFDPLRVASIARGLGMAVRTLHSVGVIHRDLKPDNVLCAGPVDQEIPKLTDCGIARVEGVATGLGAATRSYAGCEQLISLPNSQNPLIGPWTDVHAFACTIWFLIAGEQWCQSLGWFSGERRSLEHVPRLHLGFSGEPKLLRELDRILGRGASPGLPPEAAVAPGAESFLRILHARDASLRNALPRYATIDALGVELIPLLDEFSVRWRAKAARDQRPVTAYRGSTVLPSSSNNVRPLEVHESEPKRVRGDSRELRLRPGPITFQVDGKVLACAEDRVVLFVDGQPYAAVPSGELSKEVFATLIAQTTHAFALPDLGYVLVSARSILSVRSGIWRMLPRPFSASEPGRLVGEIATAGCGLGRLLVVTAETDDGDGPELWWTSDGARWEGPVLIALQGQAHCVTEGPYGVLVSGSKDGKRARAAFLHADGSLSVFSQGLATLGPFTLAVSGAERASFAIAHGVDLQTTAIVRIDRQIEREHTGLPSLPVAIALDPIGTPWVLCRHVVLRRFVDGAQVVWQPIYTRGVDKPPFVGIGFTPDGARIIDDRGGFVQIIPSDIASWRESSR